VKSNGRERERGEGLVVCSLEQSGGGLASNGYPWPVRVKEATILCTNHAGLFSARSKKSIKHNSLFCPSLTVGVTILKRNHERLFLVLEWLMAIIYWEEVHLAVVLEALTDIQEADTISQYLEHLQSLWQCARYPGVIQCCHEQCTSECWIPRLSCNNSREVRDLASW